MAAIQTLKSIRDQVLYWLDESSDTGTTFTNANNAINQAHQQRLLMQAWPFMLWDSPELITTVAGVSDYALHSEFARPFYFLNRTLNGLMTEIPFRGIEQTGALWNTETGTPNEFYLHARDSVAAQPKVAQLLSAVSSSVSDTGGATTLIVRGVTPAGVIAETITLAGTAPVSTVNTFSKVLNVTKAGTWLGTLTLKAVTDNVTMLNLAPTEFGRNYTRMFFLRTPGGGDVIEYKFYRQPSPLANDNDIPDIPPPFSQILVWDALLMFAGYNSDIGAGAVSAWRDNQMKLEVQMRQAFMEGNALGAGTRSVRYMGDGASTPRVIR